MPRRRYVEQLGGFFDGVLFVSRSDGAEMLGRVADDVDSPSRNISPSFRVRLGCGDCFYHLGHLICLLGADHSAAEVKQFSFEREVP